MLHQLESHPPRTISFVMLGPLTNLAQAIKLNPSAVGRVHNIFIMGGCISHPTPGGNVTECAEFNFYADPEAAAVVMESGLPITLVPLDVTETCRLRYTTYKDTIVPLANKSPLPAFATTFLHEMFDILASQQHRPREIPSVFDKHLSLLELSNEVVAKKKPISTEQLIETTENQTRHSSHSISLAMHDPLCMGIVIDPSVVQKTLSTVVKVETHADAITRGNYVTLIMIIHHMFRNVCSRWKTVED